jgi:hypothetical protein
VQIVVRVRRVDDEVWRRFGDQNENEYGTKSRIPRIKAEPARDSVAWTLILFVRGKGRGDTGTRTSREDTNAKV